MTDEDWLDVAKRGKLLNEELQKVVAATIERCAEWLEANDHPVLAENMRRALATEREYDPDVEPCNDAEFGCKP